MVDPFRSMPHLPLAFEATVRLQEVKRWHMVAMHRDQSVAEHSATVALLAAYVAHTAPELYFGPSTIVAWFGLVHDIAEAFVGDVPSHTKRACEGKINKLEEEYTSPFMWMSHADMKVKRLVKLCDLADAIRFADRYGASRAASNARSSLLDVYVKMQAECEEAWPPAVYEHVRDTLHDYMHS